MSAEPDNYWFPAKRHGWGWGAPRRWQGWVVLVGYLILNLLGPLLLRLPEQMWMLLSSQGVLLAALISICWKKGEPPRWRWGDKT